MKIGERTTTAICYIALAIAVLCLIVAVFSGSLWLGGASASAIVISYVALCRLGQLAMRDIFQDD